MEQVGRPPEASLVLDGFADTVPFSELDDGDYFHIPTTPPYHILQKVPRGTSQQRPTANVLNTHVGKFFEFGPNARVIKCKVPDYDHINWAPGGVHYPTTKTN